MANILCASCGSVMKPLFYVRSLFCPNGCDLMAGKSNDSWQRVPSGDYLYKILPPKEPYPADAAMVRLLGNTETEAKEAADKITLNYKHHAHIQQTCFFPITDKERNYRSNPFLNRDQ